MQYNNNPFNVSTPGRPDNYSHCQENLNPKIHIRVQIFLNTFITNYYYVLFLFREPSKFQTININVLFLYSKYEFNIIHGTN